MTSERISESFLANESSLSFPKITEIYGKDVFDLRENSIAVTLPFAFVDEKVVDKVAYKPVDKIEMNSTQAKVLDIIRDNPDITQPQIAAKLGLGKTAIQNCVVVLKKNGYIERVGSNKRGYWKVM